MPGGGRAKKAPRVESPAIEAVVTPYDATDATDATTTTTTTTTMTTSILAAPSSAAVAASKAVTAVSWLADFWSGDDDDDDVKAACECGVLEVSSSGGKSAATRLFHRYPLRLLVPKRVITYPGVDAVWCYSVTFGGGLVAGDRSGMSVSVDAGCTTVLATQGTTKVYKHARQRAGGGARGGGGGGGGGGTAGGTGLPFSSSSSSSSAAAAAAAACAAVGYSAYSASEEKTSRDTVQGLAADVREDALLAVIPDPVQAFRDSRFRQRQRVRLARGGSLALVDWITAGRAGFQGGGAGGFTSGIGGGVAPAEAFPRDPRGERWVFANYATTTEVVVDGEEILVESLRLEDEDEDEDDPSWGTAAGAAERRQCLAERMGAVHALATVILIGPRAAATAAHAATVAEPFVKLTVAGGASGVTGGGGATPGTTNGSDGDGNGDNNNDWLLVSTSALLSNMPPSLREPGGGGASGGGIIMRVAGPDTDAVYSFLRRALSPLSAEIGAPPFGERGLS